MTFVLILLQYLSAEYIAQTYCENGKLKQKPSNIPGLLMSVCISNEINLDCLGWVINYNNLALMGKGLVMDYNMLPLLRVTESRQGIRD